jgi:aryl-alcohol dehydrogenase-like predicted oxidoreductase
MKIGAVETAAVVQTALEVGITHFDTAEMYGEGRSEEFLGSALKGRRDDVVIATKFTPRARGRFRPGGLAKRVAEAAEQSLRRLETDRIDIYYQHYPDPAAPLDELLDAFDRLISAGKVLEVAISNVDESQVQAMVAAAATRPRFPLRGVQIDWSLLSRAVEQGVVPAAKAAGLGVVPYFPLASGLLTGKYRGGQLPEGSRLATFPWFSPVTEERLATVERLAAVAERHGHSLIDLAFGWLLAQESVTSVIAGATSPEQVKANAASIDWHMTASELAEVDEALTD